MGCNCSKEGNSGESRGLDTAATGRTFGQLKVLKKERNKRRDKLRKGDAQVQFGLGDSYWNESDNLSKPSLWIQDGNIRMEIRENDRLARTAIM